MNDSRERDVLAALRAIGGAGGTTDVIRELNRSVRCAWCPLLARRYKQVESFAVGRHVLMKPVVSGSARNTCRLVLLRLAKKGILELDGATFRFSQDDDYQ